MLQPAPGVFRGVMTTRADRVRWAWSGYARSCGNPGCPYIEFAPGQAAGGISRLLWDYVNDLIYVSVHYNWVNGYNPFLQVTGTPAT